MKLLYCLYLSILLFLGCGVNSDLTTFSYPNAHRDGVVINERSMDWDDPFLWDTNTINFSNDTIWWLDANTGEFTYQVDHYSESGRFLRSDVYSSKILTIDHILTYMEWCDEEIEIIEPITLKPLTPDIEIRSIDGEFYFVITRKREDPTFRGFFEFIKLYYGQ